MNLDIGVINVESRGGHGCRSMWEGISVSLDPWWMPLGLIDPHLGGIYASVIKSQLIIR
jgi:hypothetical protein